MPYARLKQRIRVAAEREAEDERKRWRQTAFIGYQVNALYRKEPLTFEQYLRQLGMAPALVGGSEVPAEDMAEVKRRAMATGERIRAMDQAR